MFWEITTGCNLRCIHCRAGDAELMSPDDLTREECCQVIDKIAEYAPLDLVFGGGEPLWRRDVFALANYAASKNLTVSLATNGALVDEAMAQRIRDAGIRRAAVSLDGASPSTHDTFRGHRGAFDASVRALRLLRELGVNTQVDTSVSRHNAHELPEILALAESLKVQAFHVFRLVPAGCGLSIPEEQALIGEDAGEILNWLEEAALKSNLKLKADCVTVSPRMPGGQTAPGQDCPPRARTCYVAHRGEVHPCGCTRVSAGNLRKSGFREIWREAPAPAGTVEDRRLEARSCL